MFIALELSYFFFGRVSVHRGLSYTDAALVVIAAEAILQASYFAGLLVRFAAAGILRVSKHGRDRKLHGDNQHTTPPAGAGGL